MGRMGEAEACLEKALSLNPRIHVQKELAWLHLEQGDHAHAISMLNDHLVRHASDYEAINLLMQCFFDTGRHEAARLLPQLLMDRPLPSSCFANNLFLCQLLITGDPDQALEDIPETARTDPFLSYNVSMAREKPIPIKPKLLFEDYRFGIPALRRSGARNTVALEFNGTRQVFSLPIIRVGRHDTNDLVLADNSVSRYHCLIVNYCEDVWIYDLGSTVGTFLRNTKVNGRMRVDNAQQLTLGGFVGQIQPDTTRLL
jgi:tetratricopeptide (TPR) repeat protein